MQIQSWSQRQRTPWEQQASSGGMGGARPGQMLSFADTKLVEDEVASLEDAW